MDNAAFIHATPARHADRDNRQCMVRSWSLSRGKALPVLLGLIQSGVALPAYAQSRDPTVTSDSPEYCDVLMNRISTMVRAASMPPPSEAATLSEAGEWMCVHGQPRGGVLRLRRAIEIMRHGDD
jgi:hypothetical protein